MIELVGKYEDHIDNNASCDILDNLLQELDDKKNKLIVNRQIHSIFEKEKEYDEIHTLINQIHHQFIKCCIDAADEVYYYHQYDISYTSNLSWLELEITKRINMLFHQYESKLNPMLIYDILYKNDDATYPKNVLSILKNVAHKILKI